MQCCMIIMQLSCTKCGYVWNYSGNKHRTSCSKCRTSITIVKHANAIYTIQERQPLSKPLDNKTIRLYVKLIDSLAFTRAKSWAKTNGQDYIELKTDDNGDASL